MESLLIPITVGLMMGLHVIKVKALDGVIPENRVVLAFHLFIVAAAIPLALLGRLTMMEGGDFHSELGTYVSISIAVLTVPLVSFWIDVARKTARPLTVHPIRLFLESVFLVPAWTYLWVFIQMGPLLWIAV